MDNFQIFLSVLSDTTAAVMEQLTPQEITCCPFTFQRVPVNTSWIIPHPKSLPEGARWRPSSQVFTAECLGTCKHGEDSEAGASIYEGPCQDRLSLDEQLPGGGDGAARLQGCPASSGETTPTSLLSYFLNRS